MKLKEEINYIKGNKKQLIPLLPLALFILYLMAQAALASEPFMPLLQESIAQSKPWVIRTAPIHKGSKEQQEVVDIAWEVSGYDKDFIYLLKAESGSLDPKQKHHKPYYRNGKEYNDYGLCGISNYYHSKIVNDKRFFTDIKWQIEQCYKLYKGGTTFYGKANIWKVKKFFTF